MRRKPPWAPARWRGTSPGWPWVGAWGTAAPGRGSWAWRPSNPPGSLARRARVERGMPVSAIPSRPRQDRISVWVEGHSLLPGLAPG